MAVEARRVFISFRYSDGVDYKNRLVNLFDSSTKVINCSEDKNRDGMSEDTIRQYLYSKLATTSVTIILLTPEALDYRRDCYGGIDDWTYDEVRYSLEDRVDNRTNGLVAVYVPEVWDEIAYEHRCQYCEKSCKITTVLDREHLYRKNMMNVLPAFKKNACPNIYDSLEDSYCSLVSWRSFCENYSFF